MLPIRSPRIPPRRLAASNMILWRSSKVVFRQPAGSFSAMPMICFICSVLACDISQIHTSSFWQRSMYLWRFSQMMSSVPICRGMIFGVSAEDFFHLAKIFRTHFWFWGRSKSVSGSFFITSDGGTGEYGKSLFCVRVGIWETLSFLWYASSNCFCRKFQVSVPGFRLNEWVRKLSGAVFSSMRRTK